jgi:hypothetical protein
VWISLPEPAWLGHGKPADIGRQNDGCGSQAGLRLQAPGGMENAPPKSGTKSSNPFSSSGESVANSKRHVVTVTTGLLVGAQVH